MRGLETDEPPVAVAEGEPSLGRCHDGEQVRALDVHSVVRPLFAALAPPSTVDQVHRERPREGSRERYVVVAAAERATHDNNPFAPAKGSLTAGRAEPDARVRGRRR